MRRSSTETDFSRLSLEEQYLTLAERLEALKQDKYAPQPDQLNPFQGFDSTRNEDSTNVVIGSFEENFIKPNSNLESYLNEPLDINQSAEEINALNSVYFINNNGLKLDLMEYGHEILRQSSDLAKSMFSTFANDRIPEAFQESQTPRMMEYLQDPIIPLGNDYLNELQARIFVWIDDLNGPAYENLVDVLNYLNLETTSIDTLLK